MVAYVWNPSKVQSSLFERIARFLQGLGVPSKNENFKNDFFFLVRVLLLD